MRTGAWIWAGAIPALVLAAYGLLAVRNESAVARLQARDQAAVLARQAAEAMAQRLLSPPLPSVADVEAWQREAGPPIADPLDRVAQQFPGARAVLVADRIVFPESRQRPQSFVAPESGSPLHLAWLAAERAEQFDPALAVDAWERVLEAGTGHPARIVARFRHASALHRAGRSTESRRLLERLVASPLEATGESGLPIDILAYRTLLQIAETDPRLSAARHRWYDALCQRTLLHWQVPESFLVDTVAPTPGQQERWSSLARRHVEVLEAFTRDPPESVEASPLWRVADDASSILRMTLPVSGGAWHIDIPETTLRNLTREFARTLIIPPQFELRLELAGHSLVSNQASTEVLARAASSNLRSCSATVSLARPDLLDAMARRRIRVFTLFILLAGAATLGAYGFAIRALQRQRTLALQQSDFTAAVSHELRAPLAAIRLLAEELIDVPEATGTRQEEYHRLMLREARRLGALIDNVLTHARLERTVTPAPRAELDLSQLVSSAARTLQPTAVERHVQLELAVPAQPVTVRADPDAITQVVVNLIDNALKHSPESSVVSIQIADPNRGRPVSHVELSIADEGPGIPVEDRDRVFEAYVRRGSELRRDTPGIGLGLSIVQRIVHEHSGHVRIDAARTKGTRFIVELPLAAPLASRPAQVSSVPCPSAPEDPVPRFRGPNRT